MDNKFSEYGKLLQKIMCNYFIIYGKLRCFIDFPQIIGIFSQIIGVPNIIYYIALSEIGWLATNIHSVYKPKYVDSKDEELYTKITLFHLSVNLTAIMINGYLLYKYNNGKYFIENKNIMVNMFGVTNMIINDPILPIWYFFSNIIHSICFIKKLARQ